jgi:hypothetical protein
MAQVGIVEDQDVWQSFDRPCEIGSRAFEPCPQFCVRHILPASKLAGCRSVTKSKSNIFGEIVGFAARYAK